MPEENFNRINGNNIESDQHLGYESVQNLHWFPSCCLFILSIYEILFSEPLTNDDKETGTQFTFRVKIEKNDIHCRP